MPDMKTATYLLLLVTSMSWNLAVARADEPEPTVVTACAGTGSSPYAASRVASEGAGSEVGEYTEFTTRFVPPVKPVRPLACRATAPTSAMAWCQARIFTVSGG